MKFERTEVFNFDGALRGMRNPMNSWMKSDSEYCGYDECAKNCATKGYKIGNNDMELAQKLIKAGSEHCKFLRQIFVSVDITAPLFWYKEFDTYKIGTTANSTSTMHKLTSKPITLDCFEIDDIENYILVDSRSYDDEDGFCHEVSYDFSCYYEDIIDFLEKLRKKYLETKDKRYWKELIRWLPESWLQTRTVTMSYANLRNMYHQRKNHKLSEWHTFCEWVESLPYAKELIIYG